MVYKIVVSTLILNLKFKSWLVIMIFNHYEKIKPYQLIMVLWRVCVEKKSWDWKLFKKKSLFYVFTFHCKILGQKWRLRVYEGPKTGAKNTACADFWGPICSFNSKEFNFHFQRSQVISLVHRFALLFIGSTNGAC